MNNLALLIRVNNVPSLVEKKGGAAGKFAQMLVPETVTSAVYDKMRGEFSKKLKEEGVDAEVSLVSPANYQRAGVSPIWKGLAIGLGSLVAAYGTYRLVKRISR